MQKKALSPLAATIMLVVFALVVGTLTMSWGKGYVQNIPDNNELNTPGVICIGKDQYRGDSLKELQVQYLFGKITIAQYKQQEIILFQQTSGK